jgi:DnaJ-class molecular chaperone
MFDDIGCFGLLQTSDATPDEIKKAYYSCMKACHPDLSGNHPESTDFCMFINEIYEVPV